MEATLRGLKSNANLNEGAKIMKDTKFDEAEVLEFVDRNADWLDEVVAAHVAQKKPKPMTNKNELVSAAKSARGFATKSEITSDKKLTVGDRTIHPDPIPSKREYLLEYLIGEKSDTNFKIKMKSVTETNLGSEVTLRLGPSASGLSVNLKGSSVSLNLESLNDIGNIKNVPEVQDYYDLSKSKLRNDLTDKTLDKQNTGSSVYITVNEEQHPAEGTSGNVRQIEIRINGKMGKEVKSLSSRNDEVANSVGNVEIVLPTFVKGKEEFLKEGERRGSFLNLQISSGRDQSVDMALKGVSSSGSPGAGAASTGSIGSRGNTAGSSSGGSKSGPKDPKLQSNLQHDVENNQTVIRITSRVLPWWASPDSFKFTKNSGGTSGSGSTEAGKAPSRSQSTNQVDRSRKLPDKFSSSVAKDKEPLRKSQISKSQSYGNIVEKTKMANNEKTDSQQKLAVGSISRKRSQIQNGFGISRGRSRKRRRSVSAITKIIKNEIKKKNDRISAKVDNAMSRKGSDLNIPKKQENFGNKMNDLRSRRTGGTEVIKMPEKMDATGNRVGKKLIDTSDVTSKIQNQKKATVAVNKVKPYIAEKSDASKAKSTKIEGSKMAGTHNTTSKNLNKVSEGVSGVSTLPGVKSDADMKVTDKIEIKPNKKLDISSSSNSKNVKVEKSKDILQNNEVNKGKSSGNTDPAAEANKPGSSGSMKIPETNNKKKLGENVSTGVQLSNVSRNTKSIFQEKAKSEIFSKNDKGVSKVSWFSPSKMISKKDTKIDMTTVETSKDTNSVEMKSQKNIPKISSYVKSNILSKENIKKDQNHSATSMRQNSNSNFGSTNLKSSQSKLKVDPLKPISKNDDGTLIDYGLKVMSRKKSKKGLNESKVSDGINMVVKNKSVNKNPLKVNENHSGFVAIGKTEIYKNKGKTHVVERKASLTQIPRLKIVLEPMKKVKNITKENETTYAQISKKDEKIIKNLVNFSSIPEIDRSATRTTNQTTSGSSVIKKYATQSRKSAASKISITTLPANNKQNLNKISESSRNPEITKMTISENSQHPSISENDVRPEKDLIYAIWLERFDRKITKDKIAKSKPPKS
ncbi:uncharacterized protein LOC112495174 isoform X2 [Cephus cinctus]|nr:uncharacterized protein LOC112495174 isoform X2 [Cephus cinctus]